MRKERRLRPPDSPRQGFFFQIPDYILYHPDLTFTDMKVFWKISCYDKSDRHTFASNEWLADELGISPQYVKKTITKLAKLEIIDIYSQDKTRDLRIHEGLDKELCWVIEKHDREVKEKRQARAMVRKRDRAKKKGV